MRKKYARVGFSILLLLFLLFFFFYYMQRSKTPVTVTLWHNYGGQLKSTMDEMITEFNATVGAEEGVFITVTAISGSSELHEKLTMAANHDPGAPSLPDLTTAYPKTAMILADKELLVDFSDYFSEEELSLYVPRFLEEGLFPNQSLAVFPTAKSTEVLFINRTIFDRFSKKSGISIDQLASFEGILNTAARYYEDTDATTPDVPHDGKAFFVTDSIFNYCMIGAKQSGIEFIKNGTINYTDKTIEKICVSYLAAAISGHVAIFDGYASDLAKTGDIVCSTGSTAGVQFFSDEVTYADNTIEKVTMQILPYPVFDGQAKVAIQRGAGMCLLKSTKQKERLATIFLKWFTATENNMHFVSQAGYLPVTEEAFGDMMLAEISATDDPKMKNLLESVQRMQGEYDFFIPPTIDGLDDLQDRFETSIRTIALENRSIFNSLKVKEQTKEQCYLLAGKAYQQLSQE